jgi:hypothetical protein
MGDMAAQLDMEHDDRRLWELAIVQRMQRGLSTTSDAFYVAKAFEDRRKNEHLSENQ